MSKVKIIKKIKTNNISNEISDVLKDELSLKGYDELKVYVPGAGIVKYDIEMALSGKNDTKESNAIETIKLNIPVRIINEFEIPFNKTQFGK